jgi:hypothetical protein
VDRDLAVENGCEHGIFAALVAIAGTQVATSDAGEGLQRQPPVAIDEHHGRRYPPEKLTSNFDGQLSELVSRVAKGPFGHESAQERRLGVRRAIVYRS